MSPKFYPNIFFFLFFYTSNISFGLVFTNETDQKALLLIKEMISEDNSGVLNSWNNSIPLCKWTGITCNLKHNRVVALNLSSSRLVGSLSPHIGNLTFLIIISLKNNSFHGEIPSGIGNLLRLQYLSLSGNSFHGHIPVNLSRCLHLTSIILNGNKLSGPIPTQLSFLPNLQKLQIDENHFSGTIPPSFGNFSANFRWFSATQNNLAGHIPSELAKISSLETLQLAYNNLSGTFPSFLFNISSIELVYLTGNKLPGTLPSDLGLNCPNLTRIDVSGNQLYGPIPSTLSYASKLRIIDLSNNSLSGPVPTNLGNLNQLQALLIWTNKLGESDKDGTNFRALLTSLSNCSNLMLLDLGDNGFTGILPNSITNLSNTLSYLSVDNNLLHGSIPSFGNNKLTNLNLLSLVQNKFTGNIPPSIGQLITLERLYMNGNLLSGEIPISIANLTRLGILNLRDNALEGNIPAFLGKCTSLQGVDLGNNSFNGPIPKEIFGLTSIYRFTLSHNHLTGSIPDEIGKMVNLDYLLLQNNQLTGEIPASLASCQTLQILRLEGNQIGGSIPEAIRQLKGLQFLDVSRNNLSGQIPVFLEDQLSALQYLNLSYNAFEGEVPKRGVFGNITTFSVTGNKNICGGITVLRLPACHEKSLKGKKRHINRKKIAIVIVACVFPVLIVCFSAFLYLMKRQGKASMGDVNAIYFSDNQHLQLSYGDLVQATDGFSSENLIGEGKYGSVYKGILQSGQVVAVKVLKLEERGASKSFFAECEALKNIRHRNLVKIITSCSSVDYRGNDFKALVFEYMGNNSLDRWLHQDITQDPKNLNLAQRVDIAIDVASALDYLHNQCETGIIHCDLKPGNVLLDKSFCAHVADFGLTKILTEAVPKPHESSTMAIRGTIGYVAPEYGMGEEPTARGDMYSYGILLLELFTGKRPTDSLFVDRSLCSYVNMSLSDKIVKIIDPKISFGEEEEQGRTSIRNISGVESCLVSIFKIGVSCSADSPNERMNASDVVTELHKIKHSIAEVTGQRH